MASCPRHESRVRAERVELRLRMSTADGRRRSPQLHHLRLQQRHGTMQAAPQRRVSVRSRLFCRSSDWWGFSVSPALTAAALSSAGVWKQSCSLLYLDRCVRQSFIQFSTSSTQTYRQATNRLHRIITSRGVGHGSAQRHTHRTASAQQPAAQPPTERAATDDSTAECNTASTTNEQTERSRPYRSSSRSNKTCRTKVGWGGSDGEATDGRRGTGNGRM